MFMIIYAKAVLQWRGSEWYTHKWWHRVFTTIFDICLIDSYLAYKFDMEAIHNSPDDLKNYLWKTLPTSLSIITF